MHLYRCYLQCVPYLIAAGTDVEQQTRIKSDQQLTDIDNKYSGFIQVYTVVIQHHSM